MQLLRLEVKNWVHHRYRVCEFTRGLVAILGENGSGKSSLFGAIRWLLTGENPNYGVKADNISQYAKEGEPSYASLEFEHNGHMAVITRHLLPEKEQSILTVDGKEAGRGDKSVTAGIEKLLGVDAKFISRFIIVAQTEIFSFIDDNQGETDKFFQRLFNTAKADKCQDVIGKSLAKISIPELSQTSDELARLQETASALLDGIVQQIAKLQTTDDFVAAQHRDQDIIRKWDLRQKAAAELWQVSQQETAYAAELVAATALCEQYSQDLTALTDAANGHETAHAAARVALGHWASYKTVAAAKDGLRLDRLAIQAQRQANPEPPLATYQELVQHVEAQNQAADSIKRTEAFIEAFTTGIASCPTCHTPAAAIAPQLAEAVSALPAMRASLANADSELAQYDVAYKTRLAWEKRAQEFAAREAQIAQSELQLVSVTPPPSPENELQQAVVDYEEFQQVKQAITPLAQQAGENKARILGLVLFTRDRKAQLTDEIAEISVTAGDAKWAEVALAGLAAKLKERAALMEQKTEAVFECKRIAEQYATAQAQEASAVKLRQWTQLAETTREALKSAPRLVAQRNLQRLEAAINELLQIFKVNFLVKVASDGTPTFVAEFFDGRRQVAQRLSIGQKTVLALAFRVAVNAMFAEEIGLLALDEPTASLDAPRIQALAPVLDKLRDLSTAKGLQCLLVTHASNLSHLFESVIELEAPELRNVHRT